MQSGGIAGVKPGVQNHEQPPLRDSRGNRISSVDTLLAKSKTSSSVSSSSSSSDTSPGTKITSQQINYDPKAPIYDEYNNNCYSDPVTSYTDDLVQLKLSKNEAHALKGSGESSSFSSSGSASAGASGAGAGAGGGARHSAAVASSLR